MQEPKLTRSRVRQAVASSIASGGISPEKRHVVGYQLYNKNNIVHMKKMCTCTCMYLSYLEFLCNLRVKIGFDHGVSQECAT